MSEERQEQIEKPEDIEDIEGWFEEVKWLVRCLEDEIR